MASKVTALFVCLFIASSAVAGPFGLTMAMSKAQIEKVCGGSVEPIEGSPGLFYTKSVPQPHSAFDGYALVVPSSTGLCQIRAVGKDISTSSHGIQLRSEYETLREALKKKYGECDEDDVLLPGSIWNDPRDFMMGLLKQERFLRAEWEVSADDEVGGEIDSIILVARAKSSDTGYLLLQYNLANNDAGQAALKEQEDDSL